MWDLEYSDIKSVIFNLIGGMLVAFLACLYGWISRRCRQWAIKQVMGHDFDKEGIYHIVYGSFILPPVHDQNGRTISHPYLKTPLSPSSSRFYNSASFSIDNPVSSAEMRSVAHLSKLFGKSRSCTPTITPDSDIISKVDASLISLGGPISNFKTEDTLTHPENDIITISGLDFVHPLSHQPISSFTPDAQYDYGIILRICPAQYPKRTWIVCAGLGEWGTSGASWFLANKWSSFFWHICLKRRKKFAALIRVRRGQDESAEIVWKQ